MPAAINPYAPPKARVEDVVSAHSDLEQERREHIRRETSIRSIGMLYYLGGGFLGLSGILVLIAYPTSNRSSFELGVAAALIGIAAVQLVMGHAIRKLRPWARNVILVFACLGVFGFPLGTLINVYILYLLLSKQGKRIFEPDYADIVAATPDVKYRTSTVTWAVLAILVLIFVGLVILGLTGGAARWLS